MVLLDERNGRLTNGFGKVPDVQVDRVILRLRQRRLPTGFIHLSMIMIPNKDLMLLAELPGPLSKF